MTAGLRGIIKSGNKKIDQEGFTHYVGLNDMYDFFTKYVRRVYPDIVWKCNMNNNPNAKCSVVPTTYTK
jgi:hypothetical protein